MDKQQIDAARKLADLLDETYPRRYRNNAMFGTIVDTVRSLATALEQAQAERDEMMDILGIGPAEDQRPRIATLEAERDRLREALGEITEYNPLTDTDLTWGDSCFKLIAIARRALHPEAGKVNASEAGDV